MKFEKGVFFRLLLSAVLASVALGIFLLNRTAFEKSSIQQKEATSGILNSVDKDVDSVLVHFGVEKGWIQKRNISLPNSAETRIERRVTIPPSIPSVQINLSLNAMAHRYSGRAIATENLRENSVVIHIEVEKRIVETIILILRTDLKRGGRKGAQINI